MWSKFFVGSALEAVLAAAAERPPSNEDSPLPARRSSLGGLRRSFVTIEREPRHDHPQSIALADRLCGRVRMLRGAAGADLVVQVPEAAHRQRRRQLLRDEGRRS